MNCASSFSGTTSDCWPKAGRCRERSPSIRKESGWPAPVPTTNAEPNLADELNQLAAARVPIILCMTCLNFYGITDAVQVGIIGGMTDIIAAQQAAEKVIML